MTTPPEHPADARAAHDPDPVVDWDAEEEAAEARERARRGSRRWWVIGVLACLVMAGIAVWWGISATAGRVLWEDAGHEVVSDSRIDVRYDVSRDPDREVVCRIVARDLRGAAVGRAEVTLPPETASRARHVSAVRTASRAVTGAVEECWYPEDGPRH